MHRRRVVHRRARVTLVEGNNATCTITNTALERATIQKDFVSAVQNPGTGIWTVTYTLTVTNPNAADPVTYDLSDAIGYPAGVTVTGVAVTRTGGRHRSTRRSTATPTRCIATGVTLAGGASESYTLVVTADVPITVPPMSATCQARVRASASTTTARSPPAG